MTNRTNNSIAVVVVLLILVFSGCKPSVPSDFLQPDEMEDVLFDYHLADAMAAQTDNYGYYQVLYRESALRKHGVTSAEFDSSMVYYMRHTERLHDIYESLADRLHDEAIALGASESDINKFSGASDNGDTTNLWNGNKAIVLMPIAPYSVYSYSIVADSSYRAGDSFVLSFRTNFIYQDGMRDGVAVLVAKYANDSVTSQFIRISSSSSYSMRINNDGNLKVKEVKGYFLLNSGIGINSKSTTLKLMSVYDIHLVRLRAVKKSPSSVQQADKDSAERTRVRKDSLEQRPSGNSMPAGPMGKEPIRLEAKDRVLPPSQGNRVFRRIPADAKLEMTTPRKMENVQQMQR